MQKRKSLSKEQIVEKIATEAKIAKIKEVVRKAFPSIEKMDSIYDAQTVVNAFGGFIASEIEKKVLEIKLSDIKLDFSEETDGKIKDALVELTELLKDESAQELSETMERLGTTLQSYTSDKAMRQPMSITIDDIVTK